MPLNVITSSPSGIRIQVHILQNRGKTRVSKLKTDCSKSLAITMQSCSPGKNFRTQIEYLKSGEDRAACLLYL